MMNSKADNSTLLRQNLDVLEYERSQIAHDLHNEIGQQLTAIRIAAQLMYRQSEGRQTHPVAGNIIKLTDQMFEVMHHLLHRLNPKILGESGFEHALDELLIFAQEHLSLQYHLSIQGDLDDLDKALQLAAYRIIQEVLTNAARHGHAKHVTVNLSVVNHMLDISITNDGVALTDSLPNLLQGKHSGMGLHGIEQRVLAWHGTLSFENTDEGVELCCSIPLIVL